MGADVPWGAVDVDGDQPVAGAVEDQSHLLFAVGQRSRLGVDLGELVSNAGDQRAKNHHGLEQQKKKGEQDEAPLDLVKKVDLLGGVRLVGLDGAVQVDEQAGGLGQDILQSGIFDGHRRRSGDPVQGAGIRFDPRVEVRFAKI